MPLVWTCSAQNDITLGIVINVRIISYQSCPFLAQKKLSAFIKQKQRMAYHARMFLRIIEPPPFFVCLFYNSIIAWKVFLSRLYLCLCGVCFLRNI